MPDNFTVEYTPQAVPASAKEPKRIHNLHGGSAIYHDGDTDLETEGKTLEVGDSITTEKRVWLQASDFRRPVKILVEEVGADA